MVQLSEDLADGVSALPNVQSSHERASYDAPPATRHPGRPKGSPNKVTADAKALLLQHGLPGIRALCKIACGQTIYRKLANGKGSEKMTPDLNQMLAAQKIVIDRLVPSLRSTELSSDPDKPLLPANVGDRDVARVILSTLRKAVTGNEALDADAQALAEPDVAGLTADDYAVVYGRDGVDRMMDAARQHYGIITASPGAPPAEGASGADGQAADDQAVVSGPDAAPEGSQPLQAHRVGQTEPLEGGRATAILVEVTPDMRQRWAIYRERDRVHLQNVFSLSEARERAAIWVRERKI